MTCKSSAIHYRCVNTITAICQIRGSHSVKPNPHWHHQSTFPDLVGVVLWVSVQCLTRFVSRQSKTRNPPANPADLVDNQLGLRLSSNYQRLASSSSDRSGKLNYENRSQAIRFSWTIRKPVLGPDNEEFDNMFCRQVFGSPNTAWLHGFAI